MSVSIDVDICLKATCKIQAVSTLTVGFEAGDRGESASKFFRILSIYPQKWKDEAWQKIRYK